MGHNICALIGKAPINENKVHQYGLAVAYENGFAIVILDEDHIYHWSKKLGINDFSHSDDISQDHELSWFWAKELGWSKFAIIQTDYFGGVGYQFACLYDDGARVIESDINTVLEALGVVPLPNLDAFDTINLTEHRITEMYYMDNYDITKGKTNMIRGRIGD